MRHLLSKLLLCLAALPALPSCCTDDVAPPKYAHAHGVRAVTEVCYAACDAKIAIGCPLTPTQPVCDDVCRLLVSNFYDACGDILWNLSLCEAVADMSCQPYGAAAVGCDAEIKAWLDCQAAR